MKDFNGKFLLQEGKSFAILSYFSFSEFVWLCHNNTKKKIFDLTLCNRVPAPFGDSTVVEFSGIRRVITREGFPIRMKFLHSVNIGQLPEVCRTGQFYTYGIYRNITNLVNYTRLMP